MSITPISAKWVIRCDFCRTEETIETQSRPSTWGHVKVERDAHDMYGCACADASTSHLACPLCLAETIAAINAVAKNAREG